MTGAPPVATYVSVDRRFHDASARETREIDVSRTHAAGDRTHMDGGDLAPANGEVEILAQDARLLAAALDHTLFRFCQSMPTSPDIESVRTSLRKLKHGLVAGMT